MVKVYGNTIQIVRGDSAHFQINFISEDEIIVDKAVFSIKKKIGDTEYVLQKVIDENEMTLTHEETENLEIGTFVFDIQVEYEGAVDTPIIGKFIVIADVTRGE